ncbi:unnamed protein product [Callosobruchus maculatus]|uniref:Uncharacterized protein n=1 Tax=Callosobruchus maculatus TaxID=64391 RepID=A0A653CCK9_CALMS|nr:unnamed protein product [Callosobruchus maculatus]
MKEFKYTVSGQQYKSNIQSDVSCFDPNQLFLQGRLTSVKIRRAYSLPRNFGISEHYLIPNRTDKSKCLYDITVHRGINRCRSLYCCICLDSREVLDAIFDQSPD